MHIRIFQSTHNHAHLDRASHIAHQHKPHKSFRASQKTTDSLRRIFTANPTRPQ
jgi:hypothetical protein